MSTLLTYLIGCKNIRNYYQDNQKLNVITQKSIYGFISTRNFTNKITYKNTKIIKNQQPRIFNNSGKNSSNTISYTKQVRKLKAHKTSQT